MSRPILIMAGGTGGHVYPALAVARALAERGTAVRWLGTRRGLEARVVPAAGIPMSWLSVGGLRGKGLATWLKAPFRLMWALSQALRVFLRYRPAAVLGMGGFAAGPGGAVAVLLRRPLVVHEQNALPGLTNRWLARFASRVLEGFPGTFPTGVGARHVGNPVRAEITALDPPDQRMGGRTGPLRLLVFGGSQGARALNETVPGALALMAADERPQVRHQAGERHLGDTREAYAAAGVEARIEAFIEDMAEAYAWADVVLCRAGALTVAELTAAGVASVLVPFPSAVDDHQTANARLLVDHSAGVLLPQGQMSPQRLAETLRQLGHDRAQVMAMALAARGLARPRAAHEVADLCLGLAGDGSVAPAVPGGRRS